MQAQALTPTLMQDGKTAEEWAREEGKGDVAAYLHEVAAAAEEDPFGAAAGDVFFGP
jgi:hypothetical protein